MRKRPMPALSFWHHALCAARLSLEETFIKQREQGKVLEQFINVVDQLDRWR
jgi:hypothetical protein